MSVLIHSDRIIQLLGYPDLWKPIDLWDLFIIHLYPYLYITSRFYIQHVHLFLDIEPLDSSIFQEWFGGRWWQVARWGEDISIHHGTPGTNAHGSIVVWCWGRCLSGDLCLPGPGPKSLWGAAQGMADGRYFFFGLPTDHQQSCHWKKHFLWHNNGDFLSHGTQWYPQIIISHGWPWLSIETAMVTTGDPPYMSIVLGCTQLPRFWVVIVIHLYLDKNRLIGTY